MQTLKALVHVCMQMPCKLTGLAGGQPASTWAALWWESLFAIEAPKLLAS